MSKRPKNLPPPPGPLLRWGPVALGLLFVVAGASKVLDPWSFYSALPGYGVTGLARSLLAVLLPPFEVALGVALLARWGLRQTVPAAAAFLGVFVLAIGYGWWRGSLQECGCFGPLLERSPGEAMAVDLAFLALAVVVARAGRGRLAALEGWQKGLLGAIGVVTLGITVSFLQSGPSGLQAIEAVPAEAEFRALDLEQGEYLVYMFHHECPHCAEMSPRVAAYTHEPGLPRVVGLTFLTSRRDIDRYRDKYDLRIPVQVMPPQMFTRVTGEGGVPQLVYLRDGRIERTWIGILPEPASLRRTLQTLRDRRGD